MYLSTKKLENSVNAIFLKYKNYQNVCIYAYYTHLQGLKLVSVNMKNNPLFQPNMISPNAINVTYIFCENESIEDVYYELERKLRSYLKEHQDFF